MTDQFNRTQFRVGKRQPTFSAMLWPDGRPEEQDQRQREEEEHKLARHFRRLSRQTARTYKSCLGRFDAWRAGRSIDDDLIAAYLEGGVRQPGSPFPRSARLLPLCAGAASASSRSPQPGMRWRQLCSAPSARGATASVKLVPSSARTWDALLLACDSDNAFKAMWSRRDAAAIALAFNCGLRVSEVRQLEVKDLSFSEEGAGALHVRFSKTDQGGTGAYLPFAAPTAARLRRWLAVSEITSGPLFPCIRAGAVSTQHITVDGLQVMLQRRLQQAGFTERHTWHDFRRGMAAQMTLNGASLQRVQKAGRWETPAMVLLYCEGAEAIRSSANDFLFPEEKPKLRAIK